MRYQSPRTSQLTRNTEGVTFARIGCFYGCSEGEICEHTIKDLIKQNSDNTSTTSSDADVHESIDEIYTSVSPCVRILRAIPLIL